MRKYICLLVLCFASICAMAQETRELKHVRLRSGLNVTGYVTNNADGSISVTTVDGDQLWYSPAEVQSVQDDPSVVEARRKAEAKAKEEAEAEKRARKDAIQIKNKGFQLMAELGYGNASDNFAGNWDPCWLVYFSECIDIFLVPCYRFNEKLLAGVGVGYKETGWHINDGQYDYVFGCGLALSAKLLYNFKSNRFTPYVSMDAGYSLMTMYLQGYMMDSAPASSRDAYYMECDLGYMFRSGLNLALTVFYSPAPKGIHGVYIENASRPGIKMGACGHLNRN